MSRRLFWDAFTRSLWIKAVAVTLVTALVVVQCGREGGKARSFGDLNYDSQPEKAPRDEKPTKPAEKLHAAVTELKALLDVQARDDLSDEQAGEARAARDRIATELRALDRQFAADRKKLEGLDADAALDRLDKIESKTKDLERSLQTALARVPAGGERTTAAGEAGELLAQLSPAKPHQPLSSDLGFDMNNAKPSPVSRSAGITPAYAAPAPTDMASQLPRAPEDEDLAETPETKVTPAIRELAQRLDRDPVKIYEYVRNKIRYEPYYGVRKGAAQTLIEMAGSDADQAALTIALLRESGIHARFVQGVAELPVAKAADWLGVDTAAGESVEAAPEILAAGGVPTTAVRANGQLNRVRFDHVWVEAHVPADAYRGVQEGIGGRAWLPLDPAIKQTRFVRPKVDLDETVVPRVKEFADGMAEGAELQDGHSAIPPAALRSGTAVKDLLDGINSDISHHFDADDTFGDLVGARLLHEAPVNYLPASTPFRPIAVTAEHRAMPQSLHARVSIEVSGADPLSMPSPDPEGSNDAGFSFTASTVDVGSSRITVSYVPATEHDAEIIDAYHGLLNAPTYAASLIPVLRVDGKVVARGQRPVSTGYSQSLAITYRSPGFARDVVENPVYVGSLSALALDLGFASGTRINERVEKWRQTAPSIDAENVMTDRHAGEAFSQLAYLYFTRNDMHNAALAQVMGVHQQRSLSGGMVATDVTPSYVASFPISTRLTGIYMDVDQDAQAVVPRDGSDATAKAYMRGAGMHASQSEGFVFEQAFGGQAASTAKVMQVAAQQGIPVMHIDAENSAAALPVLNASSGVKAEIQRAVAQGATVVIPRDEVTVERWTGSGYIIDRGDSTAYRITGGANGSFWDYMPPGFTSLAMLLGNPDWNVELVGCMAATANLLSIWNFLVAGGTGRPLISKILTYLVLRFPVMMSPAVVAALLTVIVVLLWAMFIYNIISSYTNQYICKGDEEEGAGAGGGSGGG
jgi:transglutaminase-like putative cysteine protease